MKSILTRVCVLMACAGIVAAPAIADDAELEKVRATVSQMFDGIDAEDIYASNIDGWYTIRKGAIIAYISSLAAAD